MTRMALHDTHARIDTQRHAASHEIRHPLSPTLHVCATPNGFERFPNGLGTVFERFSNANVFFFSPLLCLNGDFSHERSFYVIFAHILLLLLRFPPVAVKRQKD